MKTLGKYLKVQELQKDMTIDGLFQKYDDSSPFMFGKITGGNEELQKALREHIPYGQIIISFRRVAKVPYLGTYLVTMEDIIDVMTIDEFNNL